MNDDVIQECVTECDSHYKTATGKAMADAASAARGASARLPAVNTAS